MGGGKQLITGSTEGAVDYNAHQMAVWNGWMSGDPAGVLTGSFNDYDIDYPGFNIQELLWAESKENTGTSPLTGVVAVDPDSYFQEAENILQNARTSIESVEAGQQTQDALSRAVDQLLSIAQPPDEPYETVDARWDKHDADTVPTIVPTSEMVSYINTIRGELEAIASPSLDLASVNARLDEYRAVVDSLSADFDFPTVYAMIVDMVDDKLFSPIVIQERVEAFEETNRPNLLRARTRLASTYFDIRGVMTSQFGTDMALLERGHIRDVNEFLTQLKLSNEQQRGQLTNALVGTMTQLRGLIVESERAKVVTQLAIDELETRMERLDADRDANLVTALSAQIGQLRSLRETADQFATTSQIDITRLKRMVERDEANSRSQTTLGIMGQELALLQNQWQNALQAAGQQTALSQNWSMAKQDETNMNLQYELEDSFYDLRRFQEARDIFTSITGAASIQQKSQFERRMMVAEVGVRAAGTAISAGTGALGMGINTIGALAGGIGSDIRMKESVEQIGSFHGLWPVYRFRYTAEARSMYPSITAPGLQIGFMAQDIQKVLPSAVVTLPEGFMAILPHRIASFVKELPHVS